MTIKKVSKINKPRDKVTDLTDVIKIGDQLVAKKDNGRCVLFDVTFVCKSSASGDIVIGTGRNGYDTWTSHLRDWQEGECISASDPEAQQLIAFEEEQLERDAFKANIRQRVRDQINKHKRRYPIKSSAMEKASEPSDLGPYQMSVGTATIKMSSLADLVYNSDCASAAKSIIEEQEFILARIREELGEERFDALVADAIQILDEQP